MKNRNKASRETAKPRNLSAEMHQRLREAWFLLTVAAAVFLLIALLSYKHTDPSWSTTGTSAHISNYGGRVGAWLADVFLSLFGLVAYLFPGLMVISGWISVANERHTHGKHLTDGLVKSMGWILLMMSSTALASYYCHFNLAMPAQAGGMLGDLIGRGLAVFFNQTGSTLLFFTALMCGITFITGLSWLRFIDWVGAGVDQGWQNLWALKMPTLKINWSAFTFKRAAQAEPPVTVVKAEIVRSEPTLVPRQTLPSPPPVIVAKPVVVAKPEPVKEKKKPLEVISGYKLKADELPPFTLLDEAPPGADKPFNNLSFETLSDLVEQRLADFGVSVKVVAVHPGPIITRFELDLAPGIKVSKITGLAKDIARSLSAVSVRVVEVIPGKSVIGLEIPNENREKVTLRDILESTRYAQSRSPLSLVLGKDISGNPLVVDLAKMPHLLVAGTTGSGKSVSLNAMLLSILFKAHPDQVRLILIDPKMLELSVYDGIPHLLTPVITDMKNAANALRWCVAEMDRRYRLMAALGVRNLASYNQKVSDAIKQGQPLTTPSALVVDEASAKALLEPLPLIVVIADELADMMMVVGKKVEELIARIAQKARAAGIHLILATQRPSVDVITGLIKANIPTRVAFQVSSRIDSRTILDQQGAEQLLGHGDMLYLPPGAGVPIRVHGAYVADEEVHRVVAAWRSAGEPTYLDDVTEDVNEAQGGGEGGATGEQDALYDDAVRIVTEARRASISLVQRRLRIGYNRAARIMEEMEMAGIVSTMDTNGTREVLANAAPMD